MSVGYQAVGWNRQKRIYDTTLAVGVGLWIAVFGAVTLVVHPSATIETLLIRATGTGAFLLLHVILAIGPLCRLDRRFLPLLYNRRHLGVTMALLGATHGGLALFQFHALGVLDPLVSVLTSDGRFSSVSTLPFQIFGVGALAIILLMAATSHDFWLANLSAPVWKALHMLVYGAYALLVAHVAFGAAQLEDGGWIGGATALGGTALTTLHLLAARREARIDGALRRHHGQDAHATTRAGRPCHPAAGRSGWVEVCHVDEIPENRAKVVRLAGERIAIFRYDGKLSAVSSVCQHQNGPLGEGRILDGCITCPWHGYQYLPASGASPAPFTEKVPTFAVQLRRDRVWVDPRPYPPGTHLEPARLHEAAISGR